ncbi:MAG: valine--tRNA ligase [Candidatus Omnitrophica bacterium]|nr:valine--tRNA ligase [Candidatus Omnitrophota bacterium]
MPELPPQYNPKDVEEARYQWWESQGLFRAEPDPSRKPYTIVIPPPNVTGILHMGHALNNTIQDILIRFKRMQGFNALWVPGTDHAGIATQNVVEKALAKEGKRRQDLGRDAFIKRVWEWKEQYGNTILYQLKRLGSSCDWRRTRFTMDEGLSEAVTEVFVRLHEKGLIYRGNYIINWCPRCQTALADEEAPREETQGKLYYIRYPLEVPGSEFRVPSSPKTRNPKPETRNYVEVATTRPETMLGDTAIAVHPKDKRYKGLIGKHAILPLVNRKLPIIADEAVDPKFGTGAVKVTPAHDPVDFQLGKKHALEFLNVMTDDGRMTNVPKPYEGLDRFDCRSKLIVDLEQQGFLGPIDEHLHNVGHCYRCHTAIEPRLSLQWFVKMQPLAQPAIKAVKDGTITFVPSRWTKVYLNWMENIQDWCISRQIWWGHRLPVYYCQACAGQAGVRSSEFGVRSKTTPTNYELRTMNKWGVIVSKTAPTKCPACGGTDLRQDEDVLDTWFSSWLWPFSTLGWPKKTKDLEYFYPTSTLVTAQEIIFFWVARMIMAGYVCMKQPPFAKVYIHGTVRDLTGKKMSKSLGNIIDPLEIIDQYGTDALRYTLVTATAIGQDVFLSEERFAVGRNFANKLWNATRFVLSTVASGEWRVASAHSSLITHHSSLTVPDRWILSRLQRTIIRVTTSLDHFLFNDAANALYDFLWHDVCDWYLEIAKIQLNQTSDVRHQTSGVLVHVLETSLRLLHPIMPFVTEELWQHVRSVSGFEFQVSGSTGTRNSKLGTRNSIMVAEWPKASKRMVDDEAEALMERLQAVVTAIRNTRAELNVPLGSRPLVRLSSAKPSVRTFFETHRALLQALAQTGEVSVDATRRREKHAAAMVVDGIEILMPLAGLIDLKKEEARLQQKIEELNRYISQTGVRLRDSQFVTKAPKDVVEDTKARLAQAEETHRKLSDLLALVQSM